MFNLALLLQRNNKHPEAAEYWRRYLTNDAQSEWAVGTPVLKILRNASSVVTSGVGAEQMHLQWQRSTAPFNS
jgi:hypothetical protein